MAIKKITYDMNVRSYDKFLFEAVEVPLIISTNLKKVLKSLNLNISNEILMAEGKPFDITYIDCFDTKDKIDKVSFMPSGKVASEESENFKSRMRQEMSVGRLVNKLFPDKFQQKDIEIFVNDFKGEMSKSFSNLKLVSGEAIRYWYLDLHYTTQSSGDINNSCMKGVKAQPYFDIYCNNPEKCNLLILLNDDGSKIKGRALVWHKLRKPTGKSYLDRIYTVNDADKKLFIDYAIQHGWLYKNKQVMNDATYIDDGKMVYGSVATVLKPVMYKQYPSLDTFSYYTPTTGRLGSNAGNYIPGNPRLHLNSTTGTYTKLD
jgi:hypothetical protein